MGEAASKGFGIVMVVLYIALGTTIIFRAPLMNVRREYAVGFGVLMIAFGLFRGYQYYRRYF